MGQEDAIASAQEWMGESSAQLDAFRLACREHRAAPRFVEFEEFGCDLLAKLREQRDTMLALIDEGERPRAFEVVNAAQPPSREDGALRAAWMAVHVADEFEEKHRDLVEEAADAWLRARRSSFPGYAVLGAALKQLRLQAGLTQDALATKLKMSPVQVSHIEVYRRKRRVPLETVDAWAEACGRPLEMGFRSPRVLTDLADRWADLDQQARSSIEAAIRDAIGRA